MYFSKVKPVGELINFGELDSFMFPYFVVTKFLA